MGIEDRVRMRARYDDQGEREWERLEKDPQNRVAYEIHRRFLNRYIKEGDHVLEVGAGPGRYTFDLANMGATIEVTDYSPVQLELHRQHLNGTSAEDAVTSRALLDICDTSNCPEATFDAVLAFGGPLSYAFEEAESALNGLFRVTKPGGTVVASVMSTLGSWRFFFPGVVYDTKTVGRAANELAFTTGDLRHFQPEHVCQMFRSREIVSLVERCGAEILAMSASNWSSLSDAEVLSELETRPDDWASFLDQEEAACAEPGAVDGGTHLLFAARRC
jgi:ubiquinone/menaquinone biosynthesis C-methylase UbiE